MIVEERNVVQEKAIRKALTATPVIVGVLMGAFLLTQVFSSVDGGAVWWATILMVVYIALVTGTYVVVASVLGGYGWASYLALVFMSSFLFTMEPLGLDPRGVWGASGIIILVLVGTLAVFSGVMGYVYRDDLGERFSFPTIRWSRRGTRRMGQHRSLEEDF